MCVSLCVHVCVPKFFLFTRIKKVISSLIARKKFFF